MKIKFKRDFDHSDDGITIKTYPAGQEVEVSDACATAALRTSAGFDPSRPPEESEPDETKSKGGAPKNKSKG